MNYLQPPQRLKEREGYQKHRRRHTMKMTPLHNRILQHWRDYQPTMYTQFVTENRLEEELEKTAEQVSDLHYHLVIEEKMDYQAAWEIVQDQFFQAEEESSSKK